MRPGILLDRDGTIIVDYHYVGHIERVQLIPGAADAIARFNRAGIPVAIVTNQGGVARGFYPESNVHDVHDYIARELALHDAHIDLFLYSPYHPEGNIKEYATDNYFHKPHPGMAYQASEALGLDLARSIVVGDRITDVEFALRVGAYAVYIGNRPIPTNKRQTSDFGSLADAAGFIIERITGVSEEEFPAMQYHTPISYFTRYADEISGVLDNINMFEIEPISDILFKAYSDGSTIWIAGNGGAAAIADHMATDHMKHTAATNTLFSNIHSLGSNHSIITAIANDIGYDAIFSYQLERFGQKDDVLVVFSVSGNSQNIINALQRANEMGIKTVAIIGGINDGGRARKHASHVVVIPSGNYGVVEDVMSIIQHSLAQYIRQSQMSAEAIKSARF